MVLQEDLRNYRTKDRKFPSLY